MYIETNEPQKEVDKFSLSQNLNNLINNIDQQGYEFVPWNEVQYMIDSNIESRKINNNNEYFDANEDNEIETTKTLDQSLDKVEQYMNLLPEIINSNEDKISQKTIVIITKVIVTCLEQIEYRLQTTKQNKPRELPNKSELKRVDNLLKDLKTKVSLLKNNKLRDDINKCIVTLQQHVTLDKELEESVEKDIILYHSKMDDENEAIQKLKNDTNLLEEKFKYSLQNDASIDEKLKQLDILNSFSKENKKNSSRLIKNNNIQYEQAQEIRSC